jgi:PleD family two-component response regulator
MTLAALSARTLPFGEVDDEFDDPAMSDLAVEKGRILIVDDNAQAATLMRRLIEREGFSHVMAVGDGRRALDVVLEHPPDVVVLDVHLPHIDGYALLREIIRSDERTGRPTGVLAISGDALSETGKSMLSAGADDFIPRPFESGEFTLRVRRLAGRTRTLRRALAYSQFLERRVADLSDQ